LIHTYCTPCIHLPRQILEYIAIFVTLWSTPRSQFNHRNMKVYRGTGGICIGSKRSPSRSGHYPHEFISWYKLLRSDLSWLLFSLWLSLRNAYKILVGESE